MPKNVEDDTPAYHDGSLKQVTPPERPWRQLAFVLGEAALSLVSSGVLFIIISRVAGAELLGTYALAIAWLMMFQGVSSFGIPEFLMREVGTHGRAAAGQVLHAIVLGLGSGLVSICLMLGTVSWLGYSAQIFEAITIVSLALIPAFLNTACRSIFLALRQMHLPFLAMLIEVTIVTTASLWLLFGGYGVASLIVTLVVAKVVSASFALAMLFGSVLPELPSLSLVLLMRTAKTIITFGIGNMLAMLTMRINTIMVSVWADISTVGRFASATKILEIGLIIPSLFVQFLLTRIAYSFNTEGNRDPNRFGPWYQILFALVVPICVGVWVFAELIMETLFGTGFSNAAWILRILVVYLLIESIDAVMSTILQAAHRQRQDVIRLALNPLTNIALNLVLLPTLGSLGAAIARVSGVSVSAVMRHRLIMRELAPVHWFRFARKPVLISVATGIICYLLLTLIRPTWLLLAYVVSTAALLKVSLIFSPAAVKDMMSLPTGKD